MTLASRFPSRFTAWIDRRSSGVNAAGVNAAGVDGPGSKWPAAKGLRAVQSLALGVAICFSLGATDAGSRFTDLGHRMMCTCGCSQLLGECNHVGCPNSDSMRRELRDAIAAGTPDREILAAFSDKYGPTTLAAPSAHGFNLVAWITPFALLAMGLAGVILLIRKWTTKTTVAAAAQVSLDPAKAALRDRIRRETNGEGEL